MLAVPYQFCHSTVLRCWIYASVLFVLRLQTNANSVMVIECHPYLYDQTDLGGEIKE